MSTEIIKNEIKSFLNSESLKKEVEKLLPKTVSSDAFIRTALTALTKTPKIAECTQASIGVCLMDIAQLGLTVGRDAHLIPYGNSCTLIVDYKGLVQVLYATGKVKSIHADKVCENDKFVYNKGFAESHIIDFSKPRGKVIAYYSIVEMDGAIKTEVMTVEEVQQVQKMAKSGSSPAWINSFDEMAKKTVFRRCFKWLPIRPEIQVILEKVDAHEFDFDMQKEVKFKNIEEV